VSDFRESFGNVATDMRGVSHATLTLAPAEVQKICAKESSRLHPPLFLCLVGCRRTVTSEAQAIAYQLCIALLKGPERDIKLSVTPFVACHYPMQAVRGRD
jgi:hypothetical protein